MISDFIAIDFETSLPKWTHPCSLGITIVKNSFVVSVSNYYINPECAISPITSRIHGIHNDLVQGCPTFPQIWDELKPLFSYPIVAHNACVEWTALTTTLERYHLDAPPLQFYDTLPMSQKLQDLQSHKLNRVCEYFGLPVLNHHSSGDDSEMCARIFLALQARGIEPETYTPSLPCDDCYSFESEDSDFIVSSPAPTKGWHPMSEPDLVEADVTYDVVTDFQFNGKNFVLTGQIGDYSRSTLKQMIVSRGGYVKSSVTKKTDYLVVGFEDRNLVIDPHAAKSSKIVAAENLRDAGAKIKIIPDEFFLEILEKN